MTVIYQTTITRIGASAIDALSDQMLKEGGVSFPLANQLFSESSS